VDDVALTKRDVAVDEHVAAGSSTPSGQQQGLRLIAVLSVFLFAEPPSAASIAGIALVIVGIAVINIAATAR
jgi:hypothetical protein